MVLLNRKVVVMKKGTVIIVGLFFLAMMPVFAVDMGLGFLFNYNLITANDQSSIDFESFSDIAYLGIFFDVPMVARIGFRFSGGVKFSEIPRGQEVYGYNKNIHWDGTIGPSIHLFGESQIDPYLQVGAGSAGAVFNDYRYRDWRSRTQIVIFLHGVAGINVILADAFLVGLNVRVIPYYFNPSGLYTYEQFPLAANLNFGFRF